MAPLNRKVANSYRWLVSIDSERFQGSDVGHPETSCGNGMASLTRKVANSYRWLVSIDSERFQGSDVMMTGGWWDWNDSKAWRDRWLLAGGIGGIRSIGGLKLVI